jgi:phosphoglycerate dehydrogenase-like enzyme
VETGTGLISKNHLESQETRGAVNMRKKVLLTKQIQSLPGAEKALRHRFEVIECPSEKEREIISLVKNVNGIIAPHTDITEEIIRAAPLLQIIITPQVGFDKINVAAATKYGVPVVASIGMTSETVAEFTLGLIIALARRIPWSDRDFRQKKDWSARAPFADPTLEMGIDLYGLTIGLIGLGSIGSSVARICKAALSSRVLAYDPFVSRERMEIQGVEKRENLIDMVKEVDFLSLHMSLSNNTYHSIDESIFRSMKSDAFFINCARGEVVDEKALYKALKEKWIAGAAIDCFEEEPIKPDNPLLNMPNVIVTPHIAGITIQSCTKRGQEMVKRIIDVFAGEKPEGLINPEVWPGYLEKLNALGK